MAKKSNKEIYVADFETSHEQRNGKEYAWVWCAGYQRLFTERSDGLKVQGNIKDFVKALLQNETKKVYFHNLKFDGQFLLNYFLSHRYQYNDELNKDKQMSYVIDNTGTFYMLSVTFLNSKGQVRRCHFIDSMKIYPYSLKVLAKQMKMEEGKGDLDYEKLRYPNHKLTSEEYDYFRRDILILKIAMEEAYNKGYTKLTIGSNALEQYKESIKVGNRNGKYVFKDLFPQLTKEEDSYLRNAYKGGCCMCMKDKANLILPIHSYDINSMYPSMLRDRPMPFGVPKFFKGKWIEKENFVCVQRLKCRFFIKPKHLPCIQLKHTRIYQDNEWLENCPEQMELYLTNIDMQVFFENYDVLDIEWLDGYEFNAHTGLFKKYINKWAEVKQNTKDAGERLFSKLFLNNIYGKFGTNPKRISSRYTLKDGIVCRSENIESECDSIYLPVAIFTTSYARAYLLKYAQLNYDNFVYCDTDSIHLTKPSDNIPLHDTELGYFKYEYYGVAKHLKQKTYLVYVEKENKFGQWRDVNEYQLTCAGLNKDLLAKENVIINFDTFKLGASFPKLKTRRVIGGVYLAKELHTLK